MIINQRDVEATLQVDPRVRIYLLGPARAEWQGKSLTVCRRQARALLYRVASERQPVPREELCAMFWPDQPEASAHRNLSHVLTHLRSCLPIPDLLNASNDLVETDPEKLWCDAAEFRVA